MNKNTAYNAAASTARTLKRAGLWDLALESPPTATTALRAEILTDRFFWKIDGLRRSCHLRAALGARPQTAAAASYAAALPPGAEAEELTGIAARTARELGLTRLIKSL
ncbi:hypothetical protein [Actinomadura violacea]|uniref:Uncharacterized protein n=1 Tax=Actinomadura violacea TaxID=2819934 RepID=A0ABS3RVZ1_9ACTN|nr:hypothetical protein [Actinomadura violacea]MBO2460931.1 hypothetical protein [Actinomadura violacea]